MKKNLTSEAPLKLLDVVALLKDMPNDKLIKGQVGTIVETLDPGVYEVEFADKHGRTITSIPLTADNLMLLHFEIEMIV